MFEFGRELRRLFGGDGVPGAFKDGMTGGDASLLELLDLKCREPAHALGGIAKVIIVDRVRGFKGDSD